MRQKSDKSKQSSQHTEPRALPTYAHGLRLLLCGHFLFPKTRLRESIAIEDGRQYRVFKHVYRNEANLPAVSGVFRVWFHSRTSARFTMFYTNYMMPFFLGMQGFRSKLWLVNDSTGDFGGIYEWDTVEDAERYAASFAMRLSKMRSVPGSFSAEFFPTTDPRAATGREAHRE